MGVLQRSQISPTRETGGCAYASNRPLRQAFEKALNQLKFMPSRPVVQIPLV